jgi:hypothetical protein
MHAPWSEDDRNTASLRKPMTMGTSRACKYGLLAPPPASTCIDHRQHRSSLERFT